jgi:hypothetical protein
MHQKTIIISIALFIVIVVGMFVFAYIKKTEVTQKTQEETSTEKTTVDPYASISTITAKKYFINGEYTFVGEIPMPTPCDLVEVNPIIRESLPEQVTLNFTVLNTAQTCEQQITSQRFKVSVKASNKAIFNATLMGRSVELNIIPAAEGETPDDFELFIKG